MVQMLVVTLLVVACSLHAAWSLAPANARRVLARRLLSLPLPASIAQRLRKVADGAGSGCACDGCGQGAAAKKAAKATTDSRPAATVAPITFHRRAPR